MMTREDMLRELELLPVWQLRSTSVHEGASPISVNTVKPEAPPLTQLVPDVLSVTETKVEEVLLVSPKVIPNLRHSVSEDGQWLFILADVELSAEQQHLLDNIFKAMQLKMGPNTHSGNIAELIKSTQPKLLVSMGESVIQGLLQSNSPLQDLRGKPHEYEGVKLIATYDAMYLLNNLPDKAKAWADLRFAMQLLLETA